jgi:hypothetical protein
MFKLSNNQKAILDILGKKYEIDIHCNSGLTGNSIDYVLAKELELPISKPRIINDGDAKYPISIVEFTLEITSLDGDIKRVAGIADITVPLRKDRNAIRLGSNLLHEIEACIIM